MHCSPLIYNMFAHPKIATKFYKRYIFRKFRNFSDVLNKSVLDFGCGTGNNCFLFNPRLYLGIDIDSERVNFAKKLHPSYAFEVIEDGKINIKNGSFEYILICGVLHHLSNKQISQYLEEFVRILKSKGKFIIFEPCFFPKSILGNWVMKTFDDGKYIRSKEDYLNLFDGKFRLKVYGKLRLYTLYNMLLFTSKKI